MFLIGGVVGGIIGGLVLIEALTVRAPVIPPGTPREVASMKALDDPSGLNSDGLVAYQEKPYVFDVDFGEENVVMDQSASGEPNAAQAIFEEDKEAVSHHLANYWYGKDARLSVDGTDRGRAEPDVTEKPWSDTVTLKKNDGEFAPRAHVELPISASDLHRSLRVSAEMTVIFPYGSGGGYEVEDARLQKSATLFVVTPEEMKLALSLNNWNTRGETLALSLAYLGVAALSIWMGIVQRRKGREA
jgi:hypothetical protein